MTISSSESSAGGAAAGFAGSCGAPSSSNRKYASAAPAPPSPSSTKSKPSIKKCCFALKFERGAMDGLPHFLPHHSHPAYSKHAKIMGTQPPHGATNHNYRLPAGQPAVPKIKMCSGGGCAFYCDVPESSSSPASSSSVSAEGSEKPKTQKVFAAALECCI